ncbi:MAG: polyphosphate kinase 1 [Bacteroidota bacterium]
MALTPNQITRKKVFPPPPDDLQDTSLYINRELSWLKFNDRVLEEAGDTTHPLLERLKFISIFSSNLDEFYMIRVAGLKEQVHAGIHDIAADGLGPDVVLERISKQLHASVKEQARILEKDILPKLRHRGIGLKSLADVSEQQLDYLEAFFSDKIYPVLTPLAIDPTHPFPQLNGLGINLFVELKEPDEKGIKIAVVPIPPGLSRFIPLPVTNGGHDFVLIEDLISQFAGKLFPQMEIVSSSAFRITRNADLDISEAEADDLLKLIERELRKRRVGMVVRLEVSWEMSKRSREFLQKITKIADTDLYECPSYLDLSSFMSLMKLDYPQLKDRPFSPALSAQFMRHNNVFEAISEGDILLHHPYDNFQHVIDFVTEAANDPDVLAIKQTLYRTSGDSPIVEALKRAVTKGKQVTALIELKARFDEQNNIVWAKDLDRAGVNVVYGVLGLKTHCKISMVVRKEGNGIKRYLHLSTGNYNEKTARIYTDLGLMTCNDEMGEDASGLFNLLTGYSLQRQWKKFLVAPSNMRHRITEQIKACAEHHSEAHPARIIIVVNSLVDPPMIEELYKASQAGVKIEMVIRGICSLRPGIPGISDNITVKSIVGRFLQHPRIFYFKYNGESQIFAGSADLMQRNLNRRVELIFPVESPEIKTRIRAIIQTLLDDNQKSRYMDAEGDYHIHELPEGTEPIHAQELFMEQARERQQKLGIIQG